MQHIMLLSKLHRVTVTEADLHYEGSCGIDENLLITAKMHEFEKIELYNINNGERFFTYIIVRALEQLEEIHGLPQAIRL